MQHPILFSRFLVRLCMPVEVVLDIPTDPQLVAFDKNDGMLIVDAAVHRTAAGAAA